MARFFSPPVLAALQAGELVIRDFVSIFPRSRETGAQTHFGFWSDVGDMTAVVHSPLNGDEIREFEGAGELVGISEIPLVANLSVQRVTIDLSAVASGVEDALRRWDPEQAPVEIYRGLLDPETRNSVGPAYCRFFGTVNGSPIRTPEDGGEGSATLPCVGYVQELYRSNPDTRSHESQQARRPGDTAFRWVEAMAQRKVFWGEESSKGGAAKGSDAPEFIKKIIRHHVRK